MANSTLWATVFLAWLPNNAPTQDSGMKTFLTKADCIYAELEFRKKYKVPREPCVRLTREVYEKHFANKLVTFMHPKD